MVILRDGRKVLYQWDLGVKVVVKPVGSIDELHFVHSHHPDDAWVVDVAKKGIASVPNLCLQEGGKLYAYESINGKRKQMENFELNNIEQITNSDIDKMMET